MFPTTIWSTITQAGADDRAALDDFAERYRAPILQFIQARGYRGSDADDLCQEVFVRVLSGAILAKADPERGRFRSLLLKVTTRVIQDRNRKRRDVPVENLEPPDRNHEFDQSWALHLTERAMGQLREQGSPYYEVLQNHLTGQPQDRNRLWIARRKLSALIRQEVAHTCASRLEFEDELTYLARYLRPADPEPTAKE